MEEIQLIKNRQTGRVAAAIVVSIFLLLLFFRGLQKLNPPPGQPGIEIQFGAEDMGQNDDSNPYAEENNLEEFVEESTDDVVEEVADASEPEPSSQDVVTDDSQPAVTPPKKEPKQKQPKQPKQPKTKQPKNTKQQGQKSRDPKATFPGSKTGTGGKGTGDNGKTGPQGGDGQGTSTTGGSVGDDIGGGLSGRGLAKRVKPVNNTGHFGTVVVIICVDKNGKVIEARYTQKGSKVSDGKLKTISVNAAKQYRFEKAPYAPDKQCGTVTFKYLPG